MREQKIARHEYWRRIYRADPYCSHLTETELHRRFRDIFLNLVTITDEGLVGPPDIENNSSVALVEKFTHILEEFTIRYGPYPAGMRRDTLHSEPLPNFAAEIGRKAAMLLKRHKLQARDVLVKYGKREHIRGLYEDGEILLRPASYYRSADHNGAVRDDELSLEISLGLNDTSRDLARGKLGLDFGDIERLDSNWRQSRDYLMFCICKNIDPRMFIDFEADSCLIIMDKHAFSRRMKCVDIAQQRLQFRENHIVYMDPQLPQTASIDIPFYKHFRYTYQHEYRYVWEASSRDTELTDEKIAIGDLRDISQPVYVE